MDFTLSDNEAALVHAVSQVVQKYQGRPRAAGVSAAVHVAYSEALYQELASAGFFAAAKEPDFGAVGAVLLIEEVARSPFAVELAASALVAPLCCDRPLEGPFALARSEDLNRPIRFLPVAKSLLVIRGEELLVLPIDTQNVRANGGMYAYPFGAFKSAPQLADATRVGDGGLAETNWRIALAAEGAALMQAALNFTVDYVKTRRQFNRPIGSFQAVKHRLAACAQMVRGATWLARRAAWSGSPLDAAMAALYTQHCIPTLVYDCHQFNGAMGMTLECPLHFWTYRLKALQGELGGWPEQAAKLAEHSWAGAEPARRRVP